MRRFIASLQGKIFGQLVILTLLMPFFSISVLGRAEAQVQLLPTLAVVEFHDLHTPGSQYGTMAQEAVRSEFANTNQFTVLAPDTVRRAIETLGLQSPIQGHINLIRVGQQLRANSIVSGELAAIRFDRSASGKQAFVAMRIVVFDVASGDPINGTVVEGQSTLRTGNVSDETLVGDAIQQAASVAVGKIQQQTLPTATILNTLTDRAYINQGARTGFQTGMQVIITRGAVQVGRGRVSTVEPDQSLVMIEDRSLGISPGDHVRAIFNVPDINPERPFNESGGVEVKHPHKTGNNAGLISLLLIVGLVAVLLGGGGATNQQAAGQVLAQATLYPPQNFGPEYGTLISWSPNGWAKGFNERAAWQVWRSDFTTAPVCVTNGSNTTAYDLAPNPPGSPDNNYLNWTYFGGIIGGSSCTFTSYGNEANPGVPVVQAGISYQYQVELVYGVSQLDLPIVESTGGTGTTTAGTTTTGGTNATTVTTAGTTGTTTVTTSGTTGTTTTTTTATTTTGTTTTTTTGTTTTTTTSTTTGTGTGGTGAECYFISQRTPAVGLATPLQPPVLATPNTTTSVTSSTSFSFTGSQRAFPILIDYIIQFSTQPTFPPNTALTYNYTFQNLSAGSSATQGSNITTPPLTIFGKGSAFPAAIQGAATVYYRIGARAHTDNPGPVQDVYTKQRYIFSQFSYFNPTHG